ncbi:MAG TPA: hypothetical protein VK539_40920 [Myxococcaceae bacterium]|nr:hypothetical protein [Myxococcaceae bacterium]
MLRIRGADDQIVSDTSLFDFGLLGSLSAVPGWPVLLGFLEGRLPHQTSA